VGCEQCHGPGAAHVQEPHASNIVNPARLDFVRANDVCIQCHSQGRPRETPLNGVYYDWPVGFRAGDRLSDHWQLEEHKLGETTFTHWPDGSAHKNRMQGNDFVQSAMYTHGVTCFACHDTHGTEHGAQLVRPASDVCLTCHGPQSPNGPRGTALQHSQHSAEKATCVDCHTAHGELPKSDPASTVNPARVAETCATCHRGIYEQFVTSIHSPKVSHSKERLPGCADCHSAHSIDHIPLPSQTKLPHSRP